MRPFKLLHIILILICNWSLLQCNYPTEIPAQSDLPVSITQSPAAKPLAQAESLYTHSNFEDALSSYRDVAETLSAYPPIPEVDVAWLRLRIAQVLIQINQPAQAETILDSILAMAPKSPWAIDANILKGKRFQSEMNFRSALPFFLDAYNARPPKSDGYLSFRIAWCYQNLQEYEAAVKWYDLAIPYLPVLGDYAHYYAAKCLTKLKRSDDALSHLESIKEAFSHSPFQNEIKPDLYRSYLEKNRFSDVINDIDESLQNGHWSDDNTRATLHALKAQAFEALGEPDSVRVSYQRILRAYRFTSQALDILPRFIKISTDLNQPLSSEEDLWIGLVYLNHRQYGKAKAHFLELVKRDIDPGVYPDVLYFLNRIRYLEKSYKTAQASFKHLVDAYPDHPKGALASYHIARCIRARFGILKSLDAYKAFVLSYPDDENAPDALLFIAHQYDNRKQFGEAATYYHRVAHNYPKYKERSQAHWQEGYAYYRGRKYAQAADAYINLANFDSTSAFAPRGLYWAGKSYQKKNLVNKAQILFAQVIDQYPDSYYAFRAMKHLNVKLGRPEMTQLTGWKRQLVFKMSPTSLDLIELKQNMVTSSLIKSDKKDEVHYTRSAGLFNLGFQEEAVKELEWYSAVNSHDPHVLVDVIALYYSNRMYRQGVRASSRLERRLKELNRMNKVPWQFIYPAPYWDIIQKQADLLNLDPLFVLAVIRQESRFDAGISSWAGAYGLMQLMPATARSLAKQQKMKNYTTDRLLDPNVNITLGTNYLVELLRRFKGTPELVLAGYNGGPNRVSRWMKKRGSSDIDEFVEEINLDETRLFVKLVMNNYAQYVSQYSRRWKKRQ